jgi:peptidoglycan/LPS O-acetylase OafA/YrhL
VRLRVLDELRGVAILLVVAMHSVTAVYGTARPGTEPFWSAFVYAGGTGVTLFFLLSGILVSRPFIRAARLGVPVSLFDYGVQRALRILPLYYLVAMFGMYWTGTLDQSLNVMAFMANDLDVGEYSTVWWSLQTEVQFYIALPLFYLCYRAGGRWLLLIMLFAVCGVFLAFILRQLPTHSIEQAVGLTLSLLGRLPAFLAGIAIAYLYERGAVPSLGVRGAAPLLVAAVALLHMVLQHLLAGWGPLFALRFPASILLEAGAWSFLTLVALAWGRPLLGPASELLRYLGRISFSLYLLHIPVQYLLLANRDSVPQGDNFLFLLILLCSILISDVTYRLVERPMLRLKDRLRSNPIVPEIAS